MFSSPSNLIISFSFISAHVLGMAVPRRSPRNLPSILTEYSVEVSTQEQAIKGVQNLLTLQDEMSEEQVSSLCNELIESYYRQMEPRNRMVETAPTDSVLDSNSLEYLVAVGSRYANNVMHLARQIRRDPLDADSSSALNALKKEHHKTQMFDELLLGLADVPQSQESDEDSEENTSPSGTNDQTVMEDNEVAIQNESREGNEVASVSVMIEEEIQTTTTETVVTSYTETVEW